MKPITSYIKSKKYTDLRLSPTNIAAATDLKTLVNDGIYFGQPSSNYVNAPTELATNRFFLLEVEVLSVSWAIQTVVDFTNPGSCWRKTIHRTNIAGVNNPWEYSAIPKNSSITRDKLSDNFANNGTVATGTDFNSIIKAGSYLGLGTNTYTNIPSELAGKSFVLNVYLGGAVSSFIVQEITEIGNSTALYRRLNTNATTPGTWSKFISSGSAVAGQYFSDKIILTFGDSITENGNYPELLATYLGATVKKAGFGGCRMAQHTQSGNGLLYDKMCMHKLVDYIEAGNFSELVTAANDLVVANGDDNRTAANMLNTLDFSTVDYITVFFGTNDFASDDGAPIGTDADIDGTTFKGAINKTINKLSTSVPNAKLLFITPFYRHRLLSVGDGKNSDDFANNRAVYLQDYVNAIKDICRKHHIPVLDLMEESGINRYNQATFLSDGLHPSVSGYDHVARKITSGIESRF